MGRKYKQRKEESDEDFLQRIIRDLFTMKEIDDVILINLKRLLTARTGDPIYAELIMKMLMVMIGNAIGFFKQKKGKLGPQETFAEFTCDIFNNRYLMYVEKEFGRM